MENQHQPSLSKGEVYLGRLPGPIEHLPLCHLTKHLFSLLASTDLWGTPDIGELCTMGDSFVALYDRPIDVIDLTDDQSNISGLGDHE
jgi:hypothetical protein